MPVFQPATPPPSAPTLKALLLPLAFTLILIATNQFGYVWFHTLAELFTIIVGVSLFLLARSTFPLTNNAYLLCVSIGFFWASILDIFHTLAFEGMVMHSTFREDTPPLLWLAARTQQVLALILAPYYLGREQVDRWVFPALGLSSLAALLLVLSGWLPIAYIPDEGMTAFKITWEWLLIFGIVFAALRLMGRQEMLLPELFKAMLWIFLLMALTELSFTQYTRPSAISNMVGHLFKLWAYWLVLWLITHYMLEHPKQLIRHQSQLLQDVLSRVPGMAFQLERDPQGRYSFSMASTGAAEIFELMPEEVMEDASRAFERIEPQDLATVFNLLEQSRKTLTPWKTGWAISLPRQGNRWHNVESTAPEQIATDTYRWIGHIHDVTEHKQLREELISHRDHLMQLVDERTRELQQAMLQVEQAARARTDFLSNMSHEIRTPLNAIIGMAQIGTKASLPPQAKTYLAQIQDSGQILLALVNDILDIAKVDAGKLVLESVPINLRALIQRAIRLTAHRAEAKRIGLFIEVADTVPAGIMGDEVRVTQILVNLLGNAIKFTDQGSVTLQVSRIPAIDGCGWLMFAVEDTGIGMTPEQVTRLFSPFEQADITTSRRYGGTGLGLVISKQIVDLMQGTIHVASRPGHGSCFTVRIPCHETEVSEARPQRMTDQLDGPVQRLQGIQVFAAEDDGVNQWVLRELLEQEGADIRIFHDGVSLVAALASGERSHVVLTDIQMPGIDGYETTRQIREIAPELPVIGLTAFALPEERQRCLDAGMCDHVTKPVDIDVLVAAILRQVAAAPAPAAIKVLTAPSANDPNPLDEVLDWHALSSRLKKPALIAKMLHSLQEHHHDTPDHLVALLQAGDAEAVGALAHKIRGVAGLLAADKTRQLAEELETHAQHTSAIDPLRAESLLGELRHLLAVTKTALASFEIPSEGQEKSDT